MLPGKLCIGILEEDNPLKSYFRLKPLLVETEGRYAPFDGMQIYPEDGCIRIVPDKNESSHFKARMRRMGRYCVLDLRDHAGENDKIRPNKNYHGDETEKNAHIVYSDVVREPAENMIFEILPETGEGENIQTPRALRGDGLEIWARAAEDENAQWIQTEDMLEEKQIQRFEIEGFPGETLHFAIRLPNTMEQLTGATAPRKEAHPEPAPAPEVSKIQSENTEPSAPEKPWISHDLPAPPPIRKERMSPMQQALAAQSGLNPKRNRSLQEIIEEKWRHSRVDQLGHPVPANAMGQPVENPLERALDALRGAWRIPEIHDRLVNAIAEMQEFALQLDERRKEMCNNALRHELEDLEAERLKTMGEIDRLRREKAALRETFKQEIRAEEAENLRDALEKTRLAREEQQKYEAAAQDARKAAEFAQDAFAALNDGRFEERLKEFALTSRAVEILRQSPEPPRRVMLPSEDIPDCEEWLCRLRRACAQEGLEISEAEAANLLVCVALEGSLLISGKASSDKCGVARALARALGAMDSGCYREITGGAHLKARMPMENGVLPAVTLVRNANGAPGADISCGLLDDGENQIVISLISDGGFPLSPEALERGFMLRLDAVSAQTPWNIEEKAPEAYSPVRFSALKDALRTADDSLPPALESRLQKLRDALALQNVRLSRHTLKLMWKYCTAMLKLGKVSASEALDMAFAQKALPCILAEAPVECLMQLKELISDMPHSLKLLEAPLPICI